MAQWTLDNPVITKELRGRMRGARTYWLLFGYLLLLSLILFFSYLGWWNSHSNAMDIGGASAGFTVGRTFFKTLFYSQAVMIALITPALTAGAISIEREQRTFEMLRGTILRPRSIVWGKLASSVAFVSLLLTSSLPLLSLCFLLGGVSPGEVFFAYVLLVGDAFLFGSIGLCWSAYAANTSTATVLSYATLILFFLVTFPFAIPVLEDNSFTPNFGLCALNPVGAVTGAVVPEHYYGWTLPAWLPAILLNGTLSALLVLACINRLEDFPARRATALRWVTLLFAGLIVFFGDGVLLGLPAAMGVIASVQVLMLLSLACVLLLLFVPVLVTGDLEGWGRQGGSQAALGQAQARTVSARHRSGAGSETALGQVWSPRRVFSDATLPSGLPLALLLTALVLGLTAAALHWGTNWGVTTIMGRGYAQSPQGLAAATAQWGALSTHIGNVLEQATVMLASIVIGLAGLGFLLSVLLGNRWSALTLLYLTVVLAVALPFFSYATMTGPEALAASHNPLINTLYLCPFVPIVQFMTWLSPGSDQSFLSNGSAIPGMIGYGVWPLWVGTGALYFLVGIASYGGAWALLKRRQRIRTA